MKITNFLLFLSLLLSAYGGYDFYKKKMKNSQTKEEPKVFKRKIKEKQNLINPIPRNINQLSEEEKEPAISEYIRGQLPKLDVFFASSTLNDWTTVLSEEEFSILRQFKSTLENHRFFSQQDNEKFQLLEQRNIINAIKNDNINLVIAKVEPIDAASTEPYEHQEEPVAEIEEQTIHESVEPPTSTVESNENNGSLDQAEQQSTESIENGQELPLETTQQEEY